MSNEIIVNEYIARGTLVERDGVLYQCMQCLWLADDERSIEQADKNETPFLGWNALLVEYESIPDPEVWLMSEIAALLTPEQSQRLQQSYESLKRAKKNHRHAMDLERTKKEKRLRIKQLEAQMEMYHDTKHAIYLNGEIAKAKNYLRSRGESIE